METRSRFRGFYQIMFLVLLGLGLGLSASLTAFSEESSGIPRLLTLQEVVFSAAEKNPSVLDALDVVEIARSNLLLAREGEFDPVVTVSGNLALLGDLTSGGEISIKDTIPIAGLGKEPVALERAEISLAQAEQALSVTRQEAIYQVMGAFFTVLRSERALEAARLAEDIARTTLIDTGIRFELGNASQQDLWQAEQNYLEAQGSTAQVWSGLLNHRKKLGLVSGLNLDEEVILQRDFTVRMDKPDRTVYLQYAQERHPTLFDLVFERERADLSLEETLGERRPKIGIFASLVEDQWSLSLRTQNPEWDLDWEIQGRFYGDDSLSTAVDSFAPSSNGWGAGIEVIWVPFDGGTGREQERQERIKIEKIERSIQYQGSKVEIDIDGAIQAVFDAENRLFLSELGLKIEEANSQARSQQLEQGFITDREYRQAAYQLTLAWMNHDIALTDLILSRARLEQVSGRNIQLETILETAVIAP
ncbi:MAG TPA: TolC family protein [Atribacteraceae bacterium]|nr:TolC family protein [Atribacteraceae bacterium]